MWLSLAFEGHAGPAQTLGQAAGHRAPSRSVHTTSKGHNEALLHASGASRLESILTAAAIGKDSSVEPSPEPVQGLEDGQVGRSSKHYASLLAKIQWQCILHYKTKLPQLFLKGYAPKCLPKCNMSSATVLADS